MAPDVRDASDFQIVLSIDQMRLQKGLLCIVHCTVIAICSDDALSVLCVTFQLIVFAVFFIMTSAAVRHTAPCYMACSVALFNLSAKFFFALGLSSSAIHDKCKSWFIIHAFLC